MMLELVPIEGEHRLSEAERAALMKRIKPVSPAELRKFTAAEQGQIKVFLSRLVIFSEKIHHDMEEDAEGGDDHATHIEKLHHARQELFDKASPAVDRLVKLVDLCAMEPWQEFDVFIAGLQSEERRRYYDAKLKSGIEAAAKNPFLMQAEDHTDEDMMSLKRTKRLTAAEIEELIFHYSVEDLVKQLITSRKVITGMYWADEHYDV